MPMVRIIIEVALAQELQVHLSQSKETRKNGKARKTIKNSYGNVDIVPSRGRDGRYEPLFIKKREITLDIFGTRLKLDLSM